MAEIKDTIAFEKEVEAVEDNFCFPLLKKSPTTGSPFRP